MAVSSTSLAVTVAHAVTYLTQPLATCYPASAIARLEAALEANLASVYVATWDPSEPLYGSGHRVLTFVPDALPPRPVYSACLTADIKWSEWSRLLGNYEFDLVVDPGCVSVRLGRFWGVAALAQQVTVWSEELEARERAKSLVEAQRNLRVPQSITVPAPRASKTLAQRLMENDEAEEEALFSILADELRALTWKSPVSKEFPADVAAEKRPTLSLMGHSRSSSRSSVASSSTLSFLSDDSVSSCSSLSSVSMTTSSSASKSQRRERARVFVDTSKTEVTPYDGGKTTVLTGGVMLGGAPAKNSRAATGHKTGRF